MKTLYVYKTDNDNFLITKTWRKPDDLYFYNLTIHNKEGFAIFINNHKHLNCKIIIIESGNVKKISIEDFTSKELKYYWNYFFNSGVQLELPLL